MRIVPIAIARGSLFSPERGDEKNEEAEIFKPSQDHPEDADDFREEGEEGVGACDAEAAEIESCVVDHAADDTDRGKRILMVENEEVGAEGKQEDDDGEKGEDGESGFGGNLSLSNFDGANDFGFKKGFDFVFDGFEDDRIPDDFDAACCGTRHPSNEHEEDHENLTSKWPHIVRRERKSG